MKETIVARQRYGMFARKKAACAKTCSKKKNYSNFVLDFRPYLDPIQSHQVPSTKEP